MKLENLEKIKEIRAKINELKEKYALSKGYKVTKRAEEDGVKEIEVECKCEMEMDYMYYLIESMGKYLNYLEQDFYNYISYHNKGHLPAIMGAEKMQNALEVLGISEDYDVVKQILFANASRKDVFEIDFSKIK